MVKPAMSLGGNGQRTWDRRQVLRRLAAMGIQTVLGVVPQVYRIEPLEVIGREVIPAIADL
ncbi:MAG: hypothetical protein ACLQUY_28490 [Ktedonobacterales bacterium]